VFENYFRVYSVKNKVEVTDNFFSLHCYQSSLLAATQLVTSGPSSSSSPFRTLVRTYAFRNRQQFKQWKSNLELELVKSIPQPQ